MKRCSLAPQGTPPMSDTLTRDLMQRAASRFGAPVFGVKCTAILSNRLDLWLG